VQHAGLRLYEFLPAEQSEGRQAQPHCEHAVGPSSVDLDHPAMHHHQAVSGHRGRVEVNAGLRQRGRQMSPLQADQINHPEVTEDRVSIVAAADVRRAVQLHQ